MSKLTTVQTMMGPFDEARFGKLLIAYEENLKQDITQFEFEEGIWHRGFAFHMLQYLAPALGFGEYTGPGSIDLDQF